MENTNIIKEITSNKKVNYIFNNQKESDLIELSKYIKEQKYSQVIVSFNMDEWLKVARLIRTDDYEETLRRCNHYVALKMIRKIQYKNKRLEALNVDKFLEMFETNDENKYQKSKDNLFTIDDLSKFIEFENIRIDHIHFAIDDVSSPILSDTLSECLKEELPYNTSIYVYPGEFLTEIEPNSKCMKDFEDVYNYTLYDGPTKVKEYEKYKTYKKKQ